MEKSYFVCEPSLPQLREALAKLNKRAAKLGVAPITLNLTGNVQDEPIYSEHTRNEDGVLVQMQIGVRRRVEVVIAGEAPKFAGWSIAARIEHAAEANILRKSPDYLGDLSQYRTCAPWCDHCKTTRNRRDTFVLVHEAGTLKQLGSDCLKDFLGHQDPHRLASLAEIWFSIGEVCEAAGEESDMGGRARHLLFVRGFLAYVACARRLRGFITSKVAKETDRDSTAQTAALWMDPPRNSHGAKMPKPSDEDKAFADSVQEWVIEKLGSKPAESLSDFEHNMLTIAKCEAVEHRNAGLAAYLVEYRCRDMEQAKVAATAKHYGTVGARVRNVEISYLKSTGFDSQFGYTYIHSFAGPEGERLVWKTGSNPELTPGEKCTVTFTIKEHADFKGFPQTKIARLVFAAEKKI